MKIAVRNSLLVTGKPDGITGDQQTSALLGMSLSTFLHAAADSLDNPSPRSADPSAQRFLDSRNTFVLGGLNAINHPPARWLQRNISLAPGAYPQVCRRLAVLHRRLQDAGLITAAFHMNKPPGLRLRWHSATDDTGALSPVIEEFLATAAADQLITGCTAGCYEPESALFGGPASMHFVHQIFTVDSLAWLDHYAATTAPAPDAVPPWSLSLRMVRSVLDGLAISGWEDLGVWETVRDRGRRSLPAGFDSGGAGSEIFALIRRVWDHPGAADAELLPLQREILEQHEAGIRPILQAWTDEYFSGPAACMGPRQAAAFLIVFHWNRALLPMQWQAILTEALAGQDGPR